MNHRNSPGRSISPYRSVAAAGIAAHLALAAHDLAAGEGFMRADRAPQRFHAIRAVLEAAHDGKPLAAALVRQGNVGDYGFQAVLYAAGGVPAVIAFQTALALAAALCVVYVALRAFGSPRIATAAGVLYALLPQSLAFPHQLLSESIANPCLILGTAGVVAAMERASRAPAWLLAAAAMGIAALVRPALILLPLIGAGLLLAFDRSPRRRTRATLLAAGGLAPFVAWGLFMMSQTGRFGPGESNQDLGRNLSQSAAKVLLSEDAAPRSGAPPAWLPERLGLAAYARYIAAHPLGFLNLYLKNTLVLVADSGIGRLSVDLLGLGAAERLELQDPELGWRAQLTNHGALAMLRRAWRAAPAAVAAGVLGAAAFALVNLGALAGYVVLLRRGSALRDPAAAAPRRWVLAFVCILPLYVLATSQVVAYAPSRLRSQGEFALALLACCGWAALLAMGARDAAAEA